MLDQLKDQTDPKLLDLLKKPLATILAELNSEDRYVAGLALEALAFKLMRLLDMTTLRPGFARPRRAGPRWT